MTDLIVDLTPEGDVNSFHVPNLPDEDFRRILARTPNDRSPLTMRIKLAEIHHGKMTYEEQDCEATLLILEFRFQSRLQGRRYESASVSLEFFDKASPGSAKRDPVVVGLAPDRMHWLNKTTFDRSVNYGASASVTLGVAPVGSEASVHWDVEQKKPLNFKATLTGFPGTSKGKLGGENAVTWTMEENRGQTDGIPSFLQTAVLLQRRHPGPFFAQLRVKSSVDKVSVGFRVLSMTTDQDRTIDPIMIKPREIQVRNNSVTGIEHKDLLHMEMLKITDYFGVNLSEEDPLLPPAELSEGTKNIVPEPLRLLPSLPGPEVQPQSPQVMRTTFVPVEAEEAAARAAVKAALAAAEAAEAAAKAALLAAEAAKAVAGAADIIAKGAKAAMDALVRAAGALEDSSNSIDS